MKKTCLSFILFLLAFSAYAQRPTLQINLWEGTKPPTENELSVPENNRGAVTGPVSEPTLTVYVPQKPCGLAVIAFPGGSYQELWVGPEGYDMAEWYLSQGLTYAVLKYRMPNGHPTVPLEDVHQAMKFMRSHAREWGFTQLGVQGCSAGGHLAASAATHWVDEVTRPDFQILFYPVISMNPEITHRVSRESLIGKNPSEENVQLYSCEKQVNDQTPPAFIMHRADDTVVPLRNSLDYCQALVNHHVPVSMHVYPTGGHGGCFSDASIYKQRLWLELELWLKILQQK